ncbi:energy transducer TonB [Chryseobacterium fistulae]|uniref:TonB C-terminal domain-containing protein n=1 Tax=Chryseobacterium fistulae TaxID=2675058 RepID=A0A6N4XPA1_9FLAO|nr:hypothetical protein [Chryseobacterium fistulae]CAA7386415.1 hypothetical protein CHRY9393_00710 [Chryseobacterium fistulae]
MKKLFLFLSLLLTASLFAQQIDTLNIISPISTDYPDYEALKTKMKLDDVFVQADTAPEYPGGKSMFQRNFAEKMDIISIKGNKINTRVYFIIEKNGYVRYVSALGDDKKHAQAAELAIRRMFVRWKPAMINNQPVRFLYTFPLTLKKY